MGTVQDKMAKGTGKGSEKELACGRKDNAPSDCGVWHLLDGDDNYCNNCYDNDAGKASLEMCCTKAVSCSDVAAQWGAGIALIVIGLILALVATCGVCMCCCFGKGAPPVALTGAPPVAETM